jgi:hypothetical protein
MGVLYGCKIAKETVRQCPKDVVRLVYKMGIPLGKGIGITRGGNSGRRVGFRFDPIMT